MLTSVPLGLAGAAVLVAADGSLVERAAAAVALFALAAFAWLPLRLRSVGGFRFAAGVAGLVFLGGGVWAAIVGGFVLWPGAFALLAAAVLAARGS